MGNAASPREIFDEYDADQSGSLDESEVAKALEQLGVPNDAEHMEKLMKKYDKDGDGSIGFEEFEAMYNDLDSMVEEDGGDEEGAGMGSALGNLLEDAIVTVGEAAGGTETLKEAEVEAEEALEEAEEAVIDFIWGKHGEGGEEGEDEGEGAAGETAGERAADEPGGEPRDGDGAPSGGGGALAVAGAGDGAAAGGAGGAA